MSFCGLGSQQCNYKDCEYSTALANYDDYSGQNMIDSTVQYSPDRSMWGDSQNYGRRSNSYFGRNSYSSPYSVQPEMDFSEFGNPFVLKIHLGIRNWSLRRSSQSDEYARQIFQVLSSKLRLRYLHVILEISREQDWSNFKTYYPISPYGNKFSGPGYPLWLTTFHVEMPALTEDTISQWKMVMDLQTRLKVLICNFGSVLWTFYQQAVLNNSRTLRKVILRRVTSYEPNEDKHYPLDWSIFSRCSSLVYLKVTYMPRMHMIFGNHFIDERTDFLSHENFSWLPPNIVEVHLGNIYVPTAEFRKRQLLHRSRGWRGQDTIFSIENYKDIEYCEDDLPTNRSNNNRPNKNYDYYDQSANPMAISTAGNNFLEAPGNYWQNIEMGLLNPTQVLPGSGTTSLSVVFLCMTLIFTIGMVVVVLLVYLLK